MAQTIKNEMLWRIYAVLLLVVTVGLFVFGKAVKISVFEGDRWRDLAKEERVKIIPVDGERGNILAADGSLLATSLPFFDIRMDVRKETISDKDFKENVDSLGYCIATYLDNSFTPGGKRQDLIDARERGEGYLLVKKNVSYTELGQIRKFPMFNLGRYRGGLIVERKSKRERPFKMLAHRTVGYVREGIKPVGLEGAFDEELKGKGGELLMQKIAGGTWIPVNDLTEVKTESGNDILTTIDINLQDIVQEALLKGLRQHDADYGTAILMEVKTGAIKSIANIGRSKKGWWELYNHAVGTQMEPGSTFKLASMMAMLEDGVVKLTDTIDLEKGRTEFYEEEMVDASSHGLNRTSVQKAFEISSNVGMAKLVVKNYGKKPKATQFIKRLKEMGLDKSTGIEIAGELPPYLKEAYSSDDDWSGTTLPWMSIGYESTTSPLQMLSFYNAVANDGVMMKPYMVSEVQRFGSTLKVFKPTVLNRSIASKKTVRQAQKLLEGVVENGTARKLKSDKYRFAGKTGTSQTNYSKKSGTKHRASFIGYYPAENPVYSLIVVVNNPKEGKIYGSDVAAPIFREIADKSYASKVNMHAAVNEEAKPILATNQLPSLHVGMEKEVKTVLAYLGLPYKDESQSEWAVMRSRLDTVELQPRRISETLMPSVIGMGLRDALFLLENKGLKVKVAGAGRVVKQSLKASTKLKGQTVYLEFK